MSDAEVKLLMFLAFVLGAVAGAVIMFFVARKNPEWVQSVYEKQKLASRQVLAPAEEKVAELQKKLDAMELDKKIEAKFRELMGKSNG